MENMNRGLSLEEKLTELKQKSSAFFPTNRRHTDVICDGNELIIQMYDICEDLSSIVVGAQGIIVGAHETPFSCVVNNKCIPVECIALLQLIQKVRTAIAHGQIQVDANTMYVLGKAFDSLLRWTYANYGAYVQMDMGYAGLQILREGAFSYTHKFTHALSRDSYVNHQQIIAFESNICTNEIMEAIKNLEKLLKSNSKSENSKLNNIINLVSDTNSKLDNLIEQFSKMSIELQGVQKYLHTKLDKATTDEEREQIEREIVEYSVAEATKTIRKSVDVDSYEQMENKMIALIGNEAWNKMGDSSKKFVVSAKIYYDCLDRYGEKADYSPVCMLMTKALEVELKDRFYYKFKKYVENNYFDSQNKVVYPYGLLDKGRGVLTEDNVGLGNFAYILCHLKPKYKTPNYDGAGDERKIQDYCKNVLMKNMTSKKLKEKINYYAVQIEHIRRDYRNPAAHMGTVDRDIAGNCFEDMFAGKDRFFSTMMESFDM